MTFSFDEGAKSVRYLAILAICMMTAGCTTPIQLDRLDSAKAQLAVGNTVEAFNMISEELRIGGDRRTKAIKLFERAAVGPEKLADDFAFELDRLSTFEAAVDFVENVRLAKDVALVPSRRASALDDRINESVLTRVVSRELAPTFADALHKFPSIKANTLAVRAIVNNSIDALQQSKPRAYYRRLELTTMVEYIEQNDSSGDLRQIAIDRLTDVAFSVIELETDVTLLSPEFAAKIIDDLTTDFFITADRESRIASLDVAEALNDMDIFNEVKSEQDAEVIVSVDELEYREYSDDQPIRTVTVSYYQADPVYAALYMPKNASFLFDVREGRATVDWAYEVTVSTQEELIASDVIRGETLKSTHECLNPRVRNVFGGFNTVYDWPNQETKTYCGQSQTTVRPKDLRDDAIRQVARRITNLVNQSDEM